MSNTEIYGFTVDGEAVRIGRTHNSFRGVVIVWRVMEEKYLPPFVPQWHDPNPTSKYYRTSLMEDNDLREIWELFNNGKTSREDNIVLGSTLDHAIIMQENVPELIECYKRFQFNSTLEEQAEIIEKIYKDYVAIGFNGTSVIEGWISPDRHIKDSFGDDETVPYNLNLDNAHWDLFENID